MKNKQHGVFAIEMAFVLFFLCALLIFTGDIAYQLLNRVNLDRTSYSLVNILKERTRFFSTQNADGSRTVRYAVTQKDADDMESLAARLLGRPDTGTFGLRVESLRYNGSTEYYDRYTKSMNNTLDCDPDDALTSRRSLVPLSASGKAAPLYQITVCYRIDSWFNRFMGSNNQQAYLHSSSAIVGR